MQILASLLLAATGCSDFGLVSEGEDVEIPTPPPPDIVVSPAVLDFGALSTTSVEEVSEVVTVMNQGQGDLQIQGLELGDDTAPFDIGAPGTVLVPPGASTDFVITFDPVNAGDLDERVWIYSNDPDTPAYELPLTGTGLAPAIRITPPESDFGLVEVGCIQDRPIRVENVGNADLTIEGFSYSSASEGLSLAETQQDYGALPWVLPPGSEPVTLWVHYEPVEEGPETGYLRVLSDDPVQPQAVAAQYAGAEARRLQDYFDRVVVRPVDVIFAIDGSPSMTSDLGRLAENFDAFIGTLEELDSDYHIAAVMADDGCVTSAPPFIHRKMSSSVRQDTFDEMLAAEAGELAEAGFTLLQNALAEGITGCNAGLLREDATLALVTVSDEEEQSKLDWSSYVASFQAIKDDPDDVTMHAIAGDVPNGCDENAPGFGHADAVEETGGVFISICDNNFGPELQFLAEGTVDPYDHFQLTEQPIEDTIEVRVDEELVEEGWYYDPDTNEIVFYESYAPAHGTPITVDYVAQGDCSPDEDTGAP
jgi:hypothetical protein